MGAQVSDTTKDAKSTVAGKINKLLNQSSYEKKDMAYSSFAQHIFC